MKYMNFNERITSSYAPLPFYMTYQGIRGWEQEASDVRDLEYLQQTYPDTARKYMQKIDEILDKLDYEGSMIYDEYPDRLSVIGLADAILNVIKKDETIENEAEENPQNLKNIENMIRVLLCDAIYKRRHCGKKGKIFRV